MNTERGKYRISLCEGKIIGEIDFDEFFYERGITGPKLTQGVGKVKISAYGGEREIPHFHVWSKAKNFWCAIKLNTPEYFIHGKYVDILNNTQLKAVVKFLKSTCAEKESEKGETNWDFLKCDWNSTSRINYCTVETMPDYEHELKER